MCHASDGMGEFSKWSGIFTKNYYVEYSLYFVFKSLFLILSKVTSMLGHTSGKVICI